MLIWLYPCQGAFCGHICMTFRKRYSYMVLLSVTQCRLADQHQMPWGHMPENTIVIFTSIRTSFNFVTELSDATIKCFQIWCDFDRVSSLICGNKMPTRCNRGFYCRSYCLLCMFRAPLCPSPGAQEYYTVVAACGISCCGFQVVGLVWSWGLCVQFAGCCSILQTGHITLSSTPDQQLETTAPNTTGSNHCIILLSSWWWA